MWDNRRTNTIPACHLVLDHPLHETQGMSFFPNCYYLTFWSFSPIPQLWFFHTASLNPISPTITLGSVLLPQPIPATYFYDLSRQDSTLCLTGNTVFSLLQMTSAIKHLFTLSSFFVVSAHVSGYIIYITSVCAYNSFTLNPELAS